MRILYEIHASQIINVCPTLFELKNPTSEQSKKLNEIRDDCLRWCIQEWEWAYRTAERQLWQDDRKN